MPKCRSVQFFKSYQHTELWFIIMSSFIVSIMNFTVQSNIMLIVLACGFAVLFIMMAIIIWIISKRKNGIFTIYKQNFFYKSASIELKCVLFYVFSEKITDKWQHCEFSNQIIRVLKNNDNFCEFFYFLYPSFSEINLN